jgi:precorrin-2 methylase
MEAWSRWEIGMETTPGVVAIMAITACASRPLAVRGARSVLHRLDADDNAELSKEELKDMWNRWTPEQMDAR